MSGPGEETGFTHLGVSVGDEDFVWRGVKGRVDKVGKLLEKLPSLKDPHSEFVLLRSCFSLPKVMHLLRITDPTQHVHLWTKFYSLIPDSLTNILGSAVNDEQWARA